METFYHRYQHRLTPFLRRLTQDAELLQEAYNDVMHKVWRYAHQYRGTSRVSSWVFSIGYRTCLKMVRQAARLPATDVDETMLHTDAQTTSIDSARDIERALRRLAPRHRLVVELAYFEGLSMQEIANIAGCPQNTVKTRLHHARRKLHKLLGSAHGF